MDDAAFHVVMPLEQLREGRMHSCEIAGRELVICRVREGVFALSDICTHAEARMSEGRLRGTRLICPLHGASFDVRDGSVIGAPATQPLPTYPTRIRAGLIEVAIESHLAACRT